MDPLEVLRHLKDRQSLQLTEAYHVSTFRGHRRTQAGAEQEFTLTILDGGPTVAPSARYTCKIVADGGFERTGNPSDTVIGALYILTALERT
jgi:hypothetical protein